MDAVIKAGRSGRGTSLLPLSARQPLAAGCRPARPTGSPALRIASRWTSEPDAVAIRIIIDVFEFRAGPGARRGVQGFAGRAQAGSRRATGACQWRRADLKYYGHFGTFWRFTHQFGALMVSTPPRSPLLRPASNYSSSEELWTVLVDKMQRFRQPVVQSLMTLPPFQSLSEK